MNEQEEFAEKCIELHQKLYDLSVEGFSHRVWMAVMTTTLVHLAMEQKNPEMAMIQAVDSIKEVFYRSSAKDG